VAILVAATTGAVDDIPTPRVKEFEAGYYRFLETERPGLLTKLAETKALDDETAKGLEEAVAAYRSSFLA
jgi:F-type H+-transporting ATPase subunit alpha